MTDKKQEIMQSAIHLFSEKSYFSTSMQEIANDCGISKGSLYKFFDSKEDLLIEVIEHNRRKMLQRAMNVNLDDTLSAKERLIEKIVVQMEDFRENRDFMIMLFRAMPPHENARIPQLMKRIKAEMLNWHKECLLEAFGSKAEPYIWDLSLMFQGALKEYLSLTVQEHKNISFQKAARFLVERFDAMIHQTDHPEPVLSSEIMEEFEAFRMDLEPKSPKEQLDSLLAEIGGIVQGLRLSSEDQEELVAAVESLKNEIDESEPRPFLVRALLLLLVRHEELKAPIRRFQSAFETLYPRNK